MPAERRIELVLPGTTTEDLRMWASNVTEANPISSTIFTEDRVELVITDMQFMGVELTFMQEDRALLTLALFSDRPNEQEREIMDTEHIEEAAL